MKRIKMLFLLIMPILLTGCADTLKCQIKTNNYNSTVKVTFKEDKPFSYKYKDEMVFSPNSTDAEIYYHSKYNEYSILAGEKHAFLRSTSESVTMRISYNFTKDKSEQENKLLISKDDTKSDAMKKIESSGYKCK